MILKKLKIFNIRSYKNLDLDFPQGSILLSGDIGSGKTSILLAIEYALFGLQPGQKGFLLLRNKENLAEVSLEIEIDGKEIIIERKLKRTLKGVSNEYASITIAGKKEESSVTEIKSKIVELMGYPAEFVKRNNLLYRYTVYTPQEQMKQIILEDSEGRLNILRHIFSIDKYRNIKENTSLLISNLKMESKILQGEIKYIDEDKRFIDLKKDELKKAEAILGIKIQDLKEKKTKRGSVEKELSELVNKIAEKTTYEQEIEKSKILLGTKRENLRNTILDCQEIENYLKNINKTFKEEDYESLKINLTNLKTKKDTLESKNLLFKSNLSVLEREVDSLLSRRDALFKLEICPVCLQGVPESHKHNISNDSENKVNQNKEKIRDLKNQISLLEEEKSTIKNQISLLEEEKSTLELLRAEQANLEKSRSKLKVLERQKILTDQDINLIFKHIDSLKEKILEFSVFDSQFKVKGGFLKEVIQEEKNIEISIAELKKEIEIGEKEVSKILESIEKKENSRKKLNFILEMVEWLSTQFLNLIDFTERNMLFHIRTGFSRTFREWFSILAADSFLDSKIDDTFTPIIIQRETEMDYESLSGGERTAVALAYRLALNQTVNSTMNNLKTGGLIILDEPTDGFSESQITRFRDILENLKAKQLIIVSHEQKIEGFVDNLIKISKKNGLSEAETLKQKA
ncbi:MAG: AAA family ATPase [Nanoarchaeota archaeon]